MVDGLKLFCIEILHFILLLSGFLYLHVYSWSLTEDCSGNLCSIWTHSRLHKNWIYSTNEL